MLISDDATIAAPRILTDALRRATDAASAPPLTRLIAWCSEIVGRPMIKPVVDTSPEAHLRGVPPDRMRVMR